MEKNDLSNAIKAVEAIIQHEDDGTYEGIIRDYMGDAAPPVELLSRLNTLEHMRKQYGYNSQRVTLVKDDDPTTLAFVFALTDIKNIYITETSINHSSENLATVIIHELTHITDEINTKDFYYLGITGHQFDAQLEATKWLDNKYVLDTVKGHSQPDFIAASGETDMAQALSKYQTDEKFRAIISTGTADVWAHMIRSLSIRMTTQSQNVYV